MSKPPHPDLHAFLAVVEARSFTRAAARLNLAASTVSEAVRRVEEKLGARLLNRTTRSVIPTPEGARLAARLRGAFEAVDRALGDVAAPPERLAASLRLTGPSVAMRPFILPGVRRFVAAYPAVRLEVSVDDALVDIVKQGFDAGVRHRERLDGDMIATRISPEERMAAVAAPAYLAERGMPRTPADLDRHACIRLRLPSGKMSRWRFQDGEWTTEVGVAGGLTFDDPELVRQAALAGLGLAFLPQSFFAADIAAGDLDVVLAEHACPMSGFFLYYPGRRLPPPALQALIQCLRSSE